MQVSKTPEELRRNFRDSFHALLLSSEAYDKGSFGESARLGALIYLFVHDHGRSTSLLTLFDRKKIGFTNTARLLNPRNLLTEAPLVFMRANVTGMTYEPLLDNGPPEAYGRAPLPFSKWWDMEILRDGSRRTLSRKNIVFAMRHKEGGAHVDGFVDEILAALNRKNSMGWEWANAQDGVRLPEYAVQYATVRQIAWELEQTLRGACADLLPPAP